MAVAGYLLSHPALSLTIALVLFHLQLADLFRQQYYCYCLMLSVMCRANTDVSITSVEQHSTSFSCGQAIV